MSLLPSFYDVKDRKSINEYFPREYEIDFAENRLTGRIVEGLEAIRVWVWCCIHTERFRYALYSWQYGVSLEKYLGQTTTEEYLEVDSQAEIEEALKVHPYITGIDDFQVSTAGTKLKIKLTVKTKLGKIEVSENV